MIRHHFILLSCLLAFRATAAETALPQEACRIDAGCWSVELRDGGASILASCGDESFHLRLAPELPFTADACTVTTEKGEGRRLIVSTRDASGTTRRIVEFPGEGNHLLLWIEREACEGRTSLKSIEAVRLKRCRASAPHERVLQLPFDNDKWVRYHSYPADTSIVSCSATALYDDTSRRGFVIGAATHENWKTGVFYDAAGGGSLRVLCGYTSAATRDVLPHGAVEDRKVASEKIFLWAGDDWREGMERYGATNAQLNGRRTWNGPKPVGWNSWGRLKFDVTPQKLVQVSDYAADTLVRASFADADGVFWVNVDSGWSRFPDEELEAFIDHCHRRGLRCGAYLAPYGHWGTDHDRKIREMPEYTFDDAAKRASGRLQSSIAKAIALDPTHPAVQARVERSLERISRLGFDFLKLDFLTMASLEADRHYDPRITTGMQAYNYAMKFIAERLPERLFVSYAISPLFPSQYAHARRIACDAWNRIKQTEYTLNSVTYGWWLARAYPYIDPDHLVLEGVSERENRARLTSGIVTGLILLGDDYSATGSPVARRRAERYLTRPDINRLMRLEVPFRPTDHSSDKASRTFTLRHRDTLYLAVLNYDPEPREFVPDFARLGIPGRRAACRELWSGVDTLLVEGRPLRIEGKDALLFSIPETDQTE